MRRDRDRPMPRFTEFPYRSCRLGCVDDHCRCGLAIRKATALDREPFCLDAADALLLRAPLRRGSMAGNGRGLLADRRFLPYFLTQSIAAFNDNLFKNAVILLIVFTAAEPDLLVNLCAGAFVVPFFVASATGGQLAERLPKAVLIRWLKAAEIIIIALGAGALPPS